MSSTIQMQMLNASYYNDSDEGDGGDGYKQHQAMGMGLGTFIVGCGLSLLTLVAVIGLIVHATRFAEVYHWQTVSAPNAPQSDFTTDWFLRAEGDHRYLVIKTDTQLLDTPPIMNLDGAFPVEHMPVNLFPSTLGTTLEVNMIVNDVLDQGKSASLLIMWTGDTVLSSRMVQQDLSVGPPTYGGLLDLFVAGFVASPFLGTAVAFGGNAMHYMTRVSA